MQRPGPVAGQLHQARRRAAPARRRCARSPRSPAAGQRTHRRAARSRRWPGRLGQPPAGTSPGRATPAAASRPYRMTWISQSSPSRRAATISGQAARLRTRWKRSAGPDQGVQAAADRGGLFEPLLVGQPSQAFAQPVHRGPDVLGQRGAHLLDQVAVAVHRDRARAGCGAAVHVGQHAGRRRSAGAESLGALPDREAVVDREHHLLGRLPPAERPEVGGAVVADGAHHAQTGGRPRR